MENDYYTKIKQDDMDDFDGLIKFSNSDIKMLDNLGDREVKLVDGGRTMMITMKGVTLAYVFKYPDEWFRLSDVRKYPSFTYYKCDQTDGLMKCIEDIL